VKILALDTATEACSAALWVDGAIQRLGVELERGHAQRILGMVNTLLQDAGIKLPMLDAIAFGRGPGSFTGVRLAVSVAQGLAFGADVRVVGISDLRAVAQGLCRLRDVVERIIVCNDARMDEVYWGCFVKGTDGLVTACGSEQVNKPEDVRIPVSWNPGAAVHGAGRGFSVYPERLRHLPLETDGVQADLLPDASDIATLAVVEVQAGRTSRAEEAAAIYLRDDVARPKH